MDLRIGSKNGTPVAAPPAVVEQIHSQIQTHQEHWSEQLAVDPERFFEVEKTVHQQFSRLADQMVATLLVEASHRAALEQAKKKSWLGRLANFARQKNAL